MSPEAKPVQKLQQGYLMAIQSMHSQSDSTWGISSISAFMCARQCTAARQLSHPVWRPVTGNMMARSSEHHAPQHEWWFWNALQTGLYLAFEEVSKVDAHQLFVLKTGLLARFKQYGNSKSHMKEHRQWPDCQAWPVARKTVPYQADVNEALKVLRLPAIRDSGPACRGGSGRYEGSWRDSICHSAWERCPFLISV